MSMFFDQESLFNLDDLSAKEDELSGLLSRPVYDEQSVMDAALAHYRRAGFPYPLQRPFDAMQEINTLAQADSDTLRGTLVGYHVPDPYHPHRWSVKVHGMKSPMEAFESDKLLSRVMWLLQTRESTIADGSVRSGLCIVSGAQAAANFRPGFALHLYRRFCAPGATVLDTSSGFGGRIVGFLASQAKYYIGIDPSTKTHQGNTLMLDQLGPVTKGWELHCLPAEDVKHDVVRERCDFAFTSPPYFCKERYADEPTQSFIRYTTPDAWRDGFLLPMMRLQYAALKPGCISAVNIADVAIGKNVIPLGHMAVECGREAGFEYLREERFTLSRVPNSGRDDKFEPLHIFRKPGRS